MEKRKYIILSLSILVFLVWGFFLINSLINPIAINYVDYISEGLRIVLLTIFIILTVRKSRVFVLIGLVIIEISFLFDTLDEIETIYIPPVLQNILEEQIFFIGLLVVVFSIWKERERWLNFMYKDSLTKLGNRVAFRKEVDALIKKNKELAIVIMNFNNFKLINNSFGYEYGDKVLINLGENIKDYFGEDIFTARSSNDEFLIIIDKYKDINDIHMLCNSFAMKYKEIQTIEGIEVHVPLSIGAAIFPAHGSNRAQVFKKADMALKYSKRENTESYNMFDQHIGQFVQDEMYNKLKVVEALNTNGFKMHYQPIINTEKNCIEYAEALIRWKIENISMNAQQVVSIAEKYSLINQLDLYVVNKVCQDIIEHQLDNVKISINISYITMNNRHTIENIIRTIRDYNIDPKQICIEITETAFIDENNICYNLDRLKEVGLEVSLDDFGTGYSSLLQITNLSFDKIKIDRQFISGINNNEIKEFVINQTIEFAKKMNVSVVAEGVEEKSQYEYLVKRDCDYVQGYMISKPISPAKFKTYYKEYNSSILC